MADNTKASTDPSVATDEIGGKHHQRVKVQHGADGSATDVSAASPLPVGDASALEQLEALVALLGATLKVGDGSGALTVDGTVILGGGTAAIGKLGANSGVDIGDVTLTAGSNLVGDVGLGVRASGGLTPFRSLDLDESEEQVKATAGQIYFVRYENRSESERFLKFYNGTAASVTVGTTTPVMTWSMAPEEKGHVPIPQGFAFGTAITVAATTGLADADTGAPGANEVLVTIGYA